MTKETYSSDFDNMLQRSRNRMDELGGAGTFKNSEISSLVDQDYRTKSLSSSAAHTTPQPTSGKVIAGTADGIHFSFKP